MCEMMQWFQKIWILTRRYDEGDVYFCNILYIFLSVVKKIGSDNRRSIVASR